MNLEAVAATFNHIIAPAPTCSNKVWIKYYDTINKFSSLLSAIYSNPPAAKTTQTKNPKSVLGKARPALDELARKAQSKPSSVKAPSAPRKPSRTEQRRNSAGTLVFPAPDPELIKTQRGTRLPLTSANLETLSSQFVSANISSEVITPPANQPHVTIPILPLPARLPLAPSVTSTVKTLESIALKKGNVGEYKIFRPTAPPETNPECSFCSGPYCNCPPEERSFCSKLHKKPDFCSTCMQVDSSGEHGWIGTRPGSNIATFAPGGFFSSASYPFTTPANQSEAFLQLTETFGNKRSTVMRLDHVATQNAYDVLSGIDVPEDCDILDVEGTFTK